MRSEVRCLVNSGGVRSSFTSQRRFMAKIRIKATKTCSLVPLASFLLIITHCTIFILIDFDLLLWVHINIGPLNIILWKSSSICETVRLKFTLMIVGDWYSLHRCCCILLPPLPPPHLSSDSKHLT